MSLQIGALVLRNFVIVAAIASGVLYAQTTSSSPIQELSSDESAENTVDPASLIPDLPSLPKAEATLVGGTIQSLDRVRDELTIRVFGGGQMKTLFDPRTHVFRDGKPASTGDLKTGERIYVDTILADGQVFARNIRVTGSSPAGEGQGVVLSYRSDNGLLVVSDLLAPGPMKLHVAPSSKILRNGQQATTNELVPGTLITVKFEPQPGGRSLAREISILITPGTQFTFSGRVTFLDLRSGLLVVTSTADHKPYEIHFDPSVLQVGQDLQEGAEVTVLARYDGNQYVARGLTVGPNPAK